MTAQKAKSKSDPSVWFITGCSTGFGRELAKAVLAKGFDAWEDVTVGADFPDGGEQGA